MDIAGARADTAPVPLKALETLNALVCELVLTRNELTQAVKAVKSEAIGAPLRRLCAVAEDLQLAVLASRVLPIERLLPHLRRMARDLGAELGKQVEITLQGGDTELDRQTIAAIRDPLAHMVRNCLHHGLETPEERRRLGKPEVGAIRISAHHRAGLVSIEVADDGGGIPESAKPLVFEPLASARAGANAPDPSAIHRQPQKIVRAPVEIPAESMSSATKQKH